MIIRSIVAIAITGIVIMMSIITIITTIITIITIMIIIAITDMITESVDAVARRGSSMSDA